MCECANGGWQRPSGGLCLYGLQTPPTHPLSGFRPRFTLFTPPPIILTIHRASHSIPRRERAGLTSNPNSTGAFGIMKWPKMRKNPYKKKFFAFLVFFSNSGFYMIVRPG